MFPSYKESIATIGWLKKNSGALHIHLLRRLVRFFFPKKSMGTIVFTNLPTKSMGQLVTHFFHHPNLPTKNQRLTSPGLGYAIYPIGGGPRGSMGPKQQAQATHRRRPTRRVLFVPWPRRGSRHGSQRGENARGSLRKSHGNYRVSFNKGLGHHPHF